MKQDRKNINQQHNRSINIKNTHQQKYNNANNYIRSPTNKQKSIQPIIKINGLSNSSKQEKIEQNQIIKNPTIQTYGKKNQQSILNKSSRIKDKTRPITKNKINFQINYSNFHKNYKKYGNLFVHALKRLTLNSYSKPHKKQSLPTNNYPPDIVSTLYGQHIHNYNPYIQTLDKLYDGGKLNISKQKMERIKKLCYIGIAKNYFKSQRYSDTPKYGRVNILIRTYMYENMRNIVQEKSQNYQNIIYIPCNKGSLSFPYKNFPPQLGQICSPQFYGIVIQNVNKIIQGNYISYKKMNIKNTVTDRWGQNFIYFITFLLIMIFWLSSSSVILYILAFMILVLLGLYVYECIETLSMLGTSKNIIQKIQKHIDSYLKEINVHNMEWKVGEDFYWLEIHYIRKKKKKIKNQNNQ